MAAGSQIELIDEHVSASQCKLAVDALLTHEVKRQAEQQESQLLPGKEQTIWLGVTLKQMHAEKKLKPHRIPVAFPIVDPRSSSVCLITKDPQREYKDLLEEKKIRFISRVVGVEKLKGKFKGFEERRMLLKENDLFLADERVIPLLPALLGKKFFVAKKQPIPVCLTRKDLKGELERAISSTYYHQNQGTSASIKIGTLSQPAGHILDNLKTALPALAKVIKGGWDNIQSLGIKTGTSANLPIWTCELGPAEGGRWDGLADVEMADSEKDVGEEDGSEVVASVKATKETRSKGKKRAAEEDEEKEKPKKKAKSSAEDSIPIEKTKDVQAPKVDASAAPETPTTVPKAKKRKEKKSTADASSEAAPSVQATTPAASSSAAAEVSTTSATTDKKERRKKRKNAAVVNDDPASAAPSSDTPIGTTMTTADVTPHVDEAPAEPQAEQPKKRKPRTKKAAREAASAPDASASSAADPAPSVPVAAPAPVTPRTKKPRASAADFFAKDDAESHTAAAQDTPAPVAPPPNTPARKKRTKRVEETPVSKAIDKLVEGAQGNDAASEPQAQDQPEAGNAKPKKERRKTRSSAAAEELKAAAADELKATPTESAPSVTAEEVKAKRSASGAEKKKGKALKAKRSATKDALLGKKGV